MPTPPTLPPLVLTPRDRKALADQCARDTRWLTPPTPAQPRSPRRHVPDVDVLAECRREAQLLELPPVVTLRECAVRIFRYRDAPHASQSARRLFRRVGLEGRLFHRGGTFLVRSGDALYALRVHTRLVR